MVITASFILLSLCISAQTTTTGPGNWNSGTVWTSGVPRNNSSVTINHPLNLNVDLGIGNGSYTFNASVYSTSSSISTWGNGNLTINARTEVQDISLNNRFTMNILGCDTVFINGNFNLTGNSDLYISECAVVIVNGNLSMHNNVNATLHGILYVNGSLTATGNSGIDGNGSIQSGGQTNIWNNANFFGSNTACPGGCEYGSGQGLPIKLAYFKVEVINNFLTFRWQTLSEINNQSFEVEYSSSNKDFQSILSVEGAGNSNKIINYQEEMLAPASPEGYYRLKQTDFDGSVSHAEVVYLKASEDKSKDVNVYPNPTDGRKLFIELLHFKADQYQIDVLDNRGQIIISNQLKVEEESVYVEKELLHSQQLDRGIYYVRISSVRDRLIKKLVVE